MDIDALKPEPKGPTMGDVSRAMRILSDPNVTWALGIVRQAQEAGDLGPPRVT